MWGSSGEDWGHQPAPPSPACATPNPGSRWQVTDSPLSHASPSLYGTPKAGACQVLWWGARVWGGFAGVKLQLIIQSAMIITGVPWFCSCRQEEDSCHGEGSWGPRSSLALCPWGCATMGDPGHPAPRLRSHLWVLAGSGIGPYPGPLQLGTLLVKLGALGSQAGPMASTAHPVSPLPAPWWLQHSTLSALHPMLHSPAPQISQHCTPVSPQHCAPRLPILLLKPQCWGSPPSPVWSQTHVPASWGPAAGWAQRYLPRPC